MAAQLDPGTGRSLPPVKGETVGRPSDQQPSPTGICGMGLAMSMADPPEVAFDEAGNTGADLLNPDQPVFALASVALLPVEADELLATIRTPQSRELKFSSLKRTESGRRRLRRVLESRVLTPEHVALSLFHKRFHAVGKMVDLLIEPIAHRDGLDFYQRGFNISYCNLLHICLPVFFGAENVDRLLGAFLQMLRRRSQEAVVNFYSIARELFRQHSNTSVAGPFAPIVASESMIGEILLHNDKLSLDPAIPAFSYQCALWGERFDRPFRLVHDDSKPIFQDSEALESLMAPDDQGQRIGYDRRTFIFPLRACGIRFARSQEDPRLQVADLVAGAAACWSAGRIPPVDDSALAQDLNDLGLDRFLVSGVWPSTAISPAELGTEDEGGVDALDYMADFLAKRRK